MGAIERIEREVVLPGRRNNQCWFSPSMAVAGGDATDGPAEVLVAVMQLTANDIGPWHWIRTVNQGRTWTPPMESMALLKNPLPDDLFEWPCLTPAYHRQTDTFLGIGHTAFVRDTGTDEDVKAERHVFGVHQPEAIYALWDRALGDFEPWRRLDLSCSGLAEGYSVFPDYPHHLYECDDGTLLCPATFQRANEPLAVGTLRLAFDGAELTAVGTGTPVGVELMDGLCESSVVEFGGRYLLTIRSEISHPPGHWNDYTMYHARSGDGLNWGDLQPWRWDDGTIVAVDNTQQHWLKHEDTLYLVYTRQSELSNGVFRSRAPLFIAQVDPQTMGLIRQSERIVFPEQGARTCNFFVANVATKEAWILCGEWLQQYVPGYEKGMRFWADRESSGHYNRIQYIGDLLLARVHFA